MSGGVVQGCTREHQFLVVQKHCSPVVVLQVQDACAVCAHTHCCTNSKFQGKQMPFSEARHIETNNPEGILVCLWSGLPAALGDCSQALRALTQRYRAVWQAACSTSAQRWRAGTMKQSTFLRTPRNTHLDGAG
ncbi:hypothetical protein DUNSADRAFT_5317 [Dunaliella salina]|uniref:Encoded protein n=1 Tax=Dunaliella salina TaxID=3046 RepID=A0ABQ7FUE1_DUNSA|nr:hypothetical protein DUNSADRAFT_5317 [Dunaliella salina]|eukprot:KAF5826029.1 hypothetical protein DUNSADRAFT_5317 [Dunaliella salina]